MGEHVHHMQLDSITRPQVSPSAPSAATVCMSCQCGANKTIMTTRTDEEIRAEFDAQ